MKLRLGIVATLTYRRSGQCGVPAPVIWVLPETFHKALSDPSHVAELERNIQQVEYLGSEDYGRAIRHA